MSLYPIDLKELVEQLTRMADALERMAPPPPPEPLEPPPTKECEYCYSSYREWFGYCAWCRSSS